MKSFLGVKMVKAQEMTRGDYNSYRNWIIPKNENPSDAGYLVIYPDGYESWCPAKQFEEANKPIDGMTFGHAIEALKIGSKIARHGWNGKGMFVFKQVPSQISPEVVPKMQSLPDSVKEEFVKRGQGPNYVNQMAIVKADGSIDSWVASSSDTFAEDWYIIV